MLCSTKPSQTGSQSGACARTYAPLPPNTSSSDTGTQGSAHNNCRHTNKQRCQVNWHTHDTNRAPPPTPPQPHRRTQRQMPATQNIHRHEAIWPLSVPHAPTRVPTHTTTNVQGHVCPEVSRGKPLPSCLKSCQFCLNPAGQEQWDPSRSQQTHTHAGKQVEQTHTRAVASSRHNHLTSYNTDNFYAL